MGAKKIKSLHHNLGFQDAYVGGPNVVYHRSHRSKKGRKDFHYVENPEFVSYMEEKNEKIIEREEKRYENLLY